MSGNSDRGRSKSEGVVDVKKFYQKSEGNRSIPDIAAYAPLMEDEQEV